jgi:hypothetical protein
MRQDQVLLQLLQLLGRDVALGQQAEAGIDAVGRIALGDDGLDRGGGRLDGGVGVRRQRQRAVGGPGGAQVGQGQFAGLQGQVVVRSWCFSYLIIGRVRPKRFAVSMASS